VTAPTSSRSASTSVATEFLASLEGSGVVDAPSMSRARRSSIPHCSRRYYKTIVRTTRACPGSHAPIDVDISSITLD